MTADEAEAMIRSVPGLRLDRRIGTATARDVLLAALPCVIYGPNYARGVASAFADVCRFARDRDTIRFDYWLEQLRVRATGVPTNG